MACSLLQNNTKKYFLFLSQELWVGKFYTNAKLFFISMFEL